MKQVFIDSSAFFATLVAEDTFHPAAKALFTRARGERWVLRTTNAHVFETYALLLNRARNGRALAIAFLDHIDQNLSIVDFAEPADEGRAKALVRAHADKTYSLCDALGFVMMERLGIQEAMSFDADFRSYGRFTILSAG